MRTIFSLALFALLFSFVGYADDAAPAGLIDKIVGFGDKIVAFLDGNKGVLGSVLGFLFLVSKRFSNDKAGFIVSKVQMVFDGIAKGCEVIGKLAMRISQFLADAIKSDGIFGKQ